MKHNTLARCTAHAVCCILLFFITTVTATADEGMWLISRLKGKTEKAMKQAGLKMNASEIYGGSNALSGTVVSFGGFCTGVVVSESGLVFTNHHCGFSSIQARSSAEQDLITYGFLANTPEEEIPCEELYVSFLVRTEDVTQRVLSAVTPDMTQTQRNAAVDSMAMFIESEFNECDTLRATVDYLFDSNEFQLSVYKDYYDIRLVYAPPASIGKFGWDTDNWMWPRHTGDFAVFRIYADKNNRPAAYSKDNRPYRTSHYARISDKGYDDGDFCMTIGFPGTTHRYISSWGVEEIMDCKNEPRIRIRSLKHELWKKHMNANDSIRIKYASKYASSSNYCKNSIGMNEAIRTLGTIAEKRKEEDCVRKWIASLNMKGDSRYLQLFNDLRLGYENKRLEEKAINSLTEAFYNGPELLNLSMLLMNTIMEDSTSVENTRTAIENIYANTDMDIDRELMTVMIEAYEADKDNLAFLPQFYNTIYEEYDGDVKRFVDDIYRNSALTSQDIAEQYLSGNSEMDIFSDPATLMALDVFTVMFDLTERISHLRQSADNAEGLYLEARREMQDERNFYPDANSSMRLSFGTVEGYSPFNGAFYTSFTTTDGILEKSMKYSGNKDYMLMKTFSDLLRKKDFGRYSYNGKDMKVCFISNNDITGGNSGSPVFDAHGRLIGLAFDGNWEGMAGDVSYVSEKQRCIGVDISYILYVMDRFSHAENLIKELGIE